MLAQTHTPSSAFGKIKAITDYSNCETALTQVFADLRIKDPKQLAESVISALKSTRAEGNFINSVRRLFQESDLLAKYQEKFSDIADRFPKDHNKNFLVVNSLADVMFETGTYDSVAISLAPICNAKDPAELVEITKTTLKPGGRLLVCDLQLGGINSHMSKIPEGEQRIFLNSEVKSLLDYLHYRTLISNPEKEMSTKVPQDENHNLPYSEFFDALFLKIGTSNLEILGNCTVPAILNVYNYRK